MKILQNKTLLALLCLFTFDLAAQQKNTTLKNKSLYKKIDTFLTEGIERGFSGHVIVVVKGEKILSKGYGMAIKKSNTPITADTIFDLGSNTKQFTATAIMKLTELGKLNVNQPLSDFFENMPTDKQAITVHDLLTHASGLIESIDRDFQHIDENKFFQRVFATPLKFKPGSSYSYSNIAYSILAKIIEKTSTLSYENFLNLHFFKPLQMYQTGYLLPKWNTSLIAHGYPQNIMDVGSMIQRYQEDKKIAWHLLGNGGINSTANDMIKWINALKTNRVISKQSFNTLTSLYNLTKHNDDGSQLGYGYGWGIKLTNAKQLRVSHVGSNGRFYHSIIWYPNTDDLVIFATNADSPELQRVASQINKSLRSNTYKFLPIRKNAYQYTFDYIDANQSQKIDKLIKNLQSNYPDTIKSVDILNRIGLMLLDTEKLDWSIALLKANCKLFPTDGNLQDSLGEAFLKAGFIKQAAESFEKAIELGEENSCHWCENSQAKILEIKKVKDRVN